MCGIAGIIDIEHNVQSSHLDSMIAPIKYRGPDGYGTEVLSDNLVGLAHQRLSILDTRNVGRQPMVSPCQRYWIVFNGEIYNYLELRAELEAAGLTFRTKTDTEVLIQAYIKWGARCLDRFIGMFAFAIWDCERKELFAARDRLGIKPFYYHCDSTKFIFGSEIKSILAVVEEKMQVDVSLIDAYMDFGYVPGEETLHRGIKRLLPGH